MPRKGSCRWLRRFRGPRKGTQGALKPLRDLASLDRRARKGLSRTRNGFSEARNPASVRQELHRGARKAFRGPQKPVSSTRNREREARKGDAHACPALWEPEKPRLPA